MQSALDGLVAHFYQALQAILALISQPSLGNYFYLLTGLSVLIWLLEIVVPWRKKQRFIRRDFWLDTFYMYANLFIFPLFILNLLNQVTYQGYNSLLSLGGISSTVLISLHNLPAWLQLCILFVLRDFIHWNVHRLLHKVPFLWEMHKVHHSVQEMGYAAHLRYHVGENIAYRAFEFTLLSLIGFGIQDYFLVYAISLSIGHLNHANIVLPLGPLKYIFNSPQMHIWHHAQNLPVKTGVNFALSLSVWDYLFKTAYIPGSGRDVKLGFEAVEQFPQGFWGQLKWPFRSAHK